jgi:hypothetical protein
VATEEIKDVLTADGAGVAVEPEAAPSDSLNAR